MQTTTMTNCPDCDGAGEVFNDQTTRGPWWRHGFVPCPTCEGTGEVEVDDPCLLCGSGEPGVAVVEDEVGQHAACADGLAVILSDPDTSFVVVGEDAPLVLPEPALDLAA